MKDEGGERDSGVLSNPLSFVRAGFYRWNSSAIDARTSYGDFWLLRSRNENESNTLNISSTDLRLQHYYDRSFGFAVRSL